MGWGNSNRFFPFLTKKCRGRHGENASFSFIGTIDFRSPWVKEQTPAHGEQGLKCLRLMIIPTGAGRIWPRPDVFVSIPRAVARRCRGCPIALRVRCAD